MRIGLLHPGRMGAALGAALVGAGREVQWAAEGRSPATRARASGAGLLERAGLAEVVDACDIVVALCPPAAAAALAGEVAAARHRPGAWYYLDANALAAEPAAAVAATVAGAGAQFVGGRIDGPPPLRPGTTRLYLSGPDPVGLADALTLSDALATPLIELHIVS